MKVNMLQYKKIRIQLKGENMVAVAVVLILSLLISLPAILGQINSDIKYEQFHKEHPEIPKWNKKK